MRQESIIHVRDIFENLHTICIAKCFTYGYTLQTWNMSNYEYMNTYNTACAQKPHLKLCTVDMNIHDNLSRMRALSIVGMVGIKHPLSFIRCPLSFI